jgi:3-hydroxyisobutyrate dehydrogenase-like beta-hydroxyacid dehydrogenase
VAGGARDVATADVVITMLADDRAVEGVVAAPDFIAALGADTVHVLSATISVALAERLTALHAAAGRAYVAAPVFGRPPAAAAAQLFVVAAGDTAALARCEPVFAAIGRRTVVVGPVPSRANVVKIAGNFLLASMLEALGEGFALIRKHGIDPAQFLDVLTGSLFPAPAYQFYGGMIASVTFEPAGVAMALGLKDVRLALAAGDAAMVPRPLAARVHDHLITAIARGYGHLDWAGVARVHADAAGLPPRA